MKIALEERELFEKNNPKSFIDISFKQFVKDPLSTIEMIYKHFNIQMSEEMKENIENELKIEESPSKKHGSSKEMKDLLVLSNDEIKNAFKFYYDKFNDYL